MNILVLRLTALGDVLLTTPSIAALRAHFPDAAVDLCTSAAYAPLFAGHPHLRDVIPFDRRGSTLRQAGALRARGYDVIVDLQHKVRTGVLARFARPVRRVVFVKRRGPDVWRGLVGKPLRPGVHTAELYQLALAELGVPAPLPGRGAPLSLAVQPEAAARVDAWLREADLGPRLIALAPGAAHATKRWPIEHFVELAERVRTRGLGVPIGIGGPPDVVYLRALAAAGVAVAPPELPLVELAALLARARALVVADSGPAHLAAAVGTPVVSLFGPTDPVRWAPYGVAGRVVHRGLDCAPCSDHGGPVCPLGTHACLRDLDADTVAVALADLLAQTTGSAAASVVAPLSVPVGAEHE